MYFHQFFQNPRLNLLIKNNSSTNSNSSNSSSNSSSGDDESDHDILFPILQILLVDRKRHRVENYIEVVHNWTNAKFKKHLSLHHNIVMTLISTCIYIYIYIYKILIHFLIFKMLMNCYILLLNILDNFSYKEWINEKLMNIVYLI